jgi:thiamine biosynthesis lipoprotein
VDRAVDEINRVEKLLSAFSEDGQITEINRNAGVKPVKVNAEIYRLIDRALNISELTQGAFDITFTATEGKSKSADYKSLVLDPEKNTVFLSDKNMRIGFGAISKGYAADRAKYILQLMGVASGVVNAGGDLLAWGLQPNNEAWTIASADPDQDNQPYSGIKISNMAVATSGNFETDTAISNSKYPINVDSKKGFPVSMLKKVSVVSPTAELSDAMATPIMSMGVNAGLYLINKLQQLACVIIDDHDRIYTSKEINFLT